jgi:hypothetical protein
LFILKLLASPGHSACSIILDVCSGIPTSNSCDLDRRRRAPSKRQQQQQLTVRTYYSYVYMPTAHELNNESLAAAF